MEWSCPDPSRPLFNVRSLRVKTDGWMAAEVGQSFYSFFFLNISVKSQGFNLVGTKGKKAGGHRFIMSWPTGHSVCEII